MSESEVRKEKHILEDVQSIDESHILMNTKVQIKKENDIIVNQEGVQSNISKKENEIKSIKEKKLLEQIERRKLLEEYKRKKQEKKNKYFVYLNNIIN